MKYNQWFKGENRAKNEQDGFPALQNCDVHTNLGECMPQLALATDSTTPNEACVSAIVSNGDVFFFSTATGKIWKRTSAGTTSLVHTNTQGANLGCALWQGYLYYATSAKLGRIAEANASSEASWSSQNDSWQTFPRSGAYKPMTEKGSALYIGDGYQVALVDASHAFVSDALVLPTKYTVSAMTPVGDDILVGTIIGANIPYCAVFLWDRVSPRFNLSDNVSEIGVNAFIPCDNLTLAQCGVYGRIYYWNGSEMVQFKQIKGVTTTVNPYAVAEYRGRSLIGIGTRIYSIYREDGDFPFAIAQEYTAGSVIKSIIGKTNDILVSSNKIEKLATTYATAVIETPEFTEKCSTVYVPYYSYPAGIGIEVKIDGGTYVARTSVIDTQKMVVRFDGGIGEPNFIQARVTLTPSGSNRPIIKSVAIE